MTAGATSSVHDDDFTAFATAQWSKLVRSAVLMGCCLPEAEDLAQTTLLRCYLAWNRVTRTADPEAYLYRMLFNARSDSRRRRWWGEVPSETVPDHLDARDEIAKVDDADALRRALLKLKPGQREAVVLRFYAHLDERQIADVLKIAPGTVKSRLSRALAVLSEDSVLATDSRRRAAR